MVSRETRWTMARTMGGWGLVLATACGGAASEVPDAAPPAEASLTTESRAEPASPRVRTQQAGDGPGSIERGRVIEEAEPRPEVQVFVGDDAPALAVVRAGALALQVERMGDRVSACLYRSSNDGSLAAVSVFPAYCAETPPPTVDGNGSSVVVTAGPADRRVTLNLAVGSIAVEFGTRESAWQALADVGHALAGRCSYPREVPRATIDENPPVLGVRCKQGIELNVDGRRLEIFHGRALALREPACLGFADARDFELVNYSDGGGLCFRDVVIDRYSTATDIREAFGGRCTGSDHELVCDGVRFDIGESAARVAASSAGPAERR